MRNLLFRATILLGLGAASGRAEVEFVGYTTHGGETRFTLVDGAARLASGWVPVGGSFQGCTVLAFDARAEVLTVNKAGMPVRLPLRVVPTNAPAAEGGRFLSDEEIAGAQAQLKERQATLAQLKAERAAALARQEQLRGPR